MQSLYDGLSPLGEPDTRPDPLPPSPLGKVASNDFHSRHAPVLDSLAPCEPGLWSFGHVTVERVEAGPLTLTRDGDQLRVAHSLTPDDLSERLVAWVTASIEDADFGQDEFESTMVGLVRSTVDGALESWTIYYRNSLNELLDGTADFAPIHEKAERTGPRFRSRPRVVLRIPAAATRRAPESVRHRNRHPARHHDPPRRRGPGTRHHDLRTLCATPARTGSRQQRRHRHRHPPPRTRRRKHRGAVISRRPSASPATGLSSPSPTRTRQRPATDTSAPSTPRRSRSSANRRDARSRCSSTTAAGSSSTAYHLMTRAGAPESGAAAPSDR